MQEVVVENHVGPSGVDGPVNAIVPFFEHSNGKTYAYNIPSYFNTGPLVPAYAYTKEGLRYSAPSTVEGLSLGNMRDWAEVNSNASGGNMYVVVDHGLEEGEVWPHGHVYVATELNDGFQFSRITENKAFFHSVSSGDIDGDGLDDILVSHLGTNFGATDRNINSFIQQPDGSFVESTAIADAMGYDWGTGAVLVADLNGGTNEIIEVAYNVTSEPQYALKIYEGSDSSGFETSIVVPRAGLFETMGGTRVREIDIQRDGYLDFVISLEGTLADGEVGYTGNGLEILLGDEFGGFDYRTNDFLAENAWYFDELQFREFEVVDFDFDGWEDIVLHSWSGDQINLYHGARDLGPAIFRNVNGERFEQLSDVTFDLGDGGSGFWWGSTTRFVGADPQAGHLEFFTLSTHGSEVGVALSTYVTPSYRDASELLFLKHEGDIVFGYGGDDTFLAEGGGTGIGGEGLDVAKFAGLRSDFTVQTLDDRTSVSSLDATPAFVVEEIERLEFTNGTLAFDTDGNAGQTYRLYQAAFARDPDSEGLGFWIDSYDNGNVDLVSMANYFMSSTEFEQMYGSRETLDDRSYLTLLYSNVLDRIPDEDGFDFWSDQQNAGLSRQEMLQYFSESVENYDNVASEIANGIWYI